ncbi:perlucin-like protein [Pecten maximus]|uniref:perlucin-like protein n=1 Tax=Pecten maximus TaxID=6579 RepID=UPI0014587B41|nr:perlucin-like protein [Pecten maximus]
MEFSPILLMFLKICLSFQQITPDVQGGSQDSQVIDFTEHITEIHGLVQSNTKYLQQYEELMSSLKELVILTCGDGWVYFEDHCYWYSRTATTWQAARDLCQAMDTDLVDVTGFQENRFIKYHMRDIQKREHPAVLRYYFLGGTDMDNEGRWVWVRTGQSFGFTNWASGEPSNSNGVEDCVILNGESFADWNDAPCDQSYYGICKKSVKSMRLS